MDAAGTSHATQSAYEQARVDPSTKVLERMSRGEELVAVLELAEQFPARHAGRLEFPVLPT